MIDWGAFFKSIIRTTLILCFVLLIITIPLTIIQTKDAKEARFTTYYAQHEGRVKR